MKNIAAILKSQQQRLYVVVYLQITMTLSLALLWLYVNNSIYSFSAVLGGISWTIPTFYFIRKTFRSSGSRAFEDIAKDFYVAEMIKLLFSGILIVVFVKFCPIILMPFLSTYIGAIIVSFVAPFFIV
jgi:ATP synthase protein I